jgi:hypothetical protein
MDSLYYIHEISVIGEIVCQIWNLVYQETRHGVQWEFCGNADVISGTISTAAQ